MLHEDVSNYAALYNLACVYKDQYYVTGDTERLDAAEQLLRRAVETNPDRKEAWNACVRKRLGLARRRNAPHCNS